jgi:hypothetical protein
MSASQDSSDSSDNFYPVVEPKSPFNVVRPRGVSPTCMWTVKAPLRRGFPLGLRNIAGCFPAVLGAGSGT